MTMRWPFVTLLLLHGPVLACTQAATHPFRLAIAGGSLTEIVYFLGAEERIVATDTTSNYPDTANGFPSVGYVRNLSAEGLLSLNPGLILGEDDMGPPEVLALVAQTGVEIVRVPEQHTAAGIIDKVRCVARVLNLQPGAEQQIAERLEPLLASLARLNEHPGSSPPRVVLLLGLRDGIPIAAGHNTSGDGFLKMAGAENVFSNMDGWKPVSLEALASANPEYIIMPKRNVEQVGGAAAVAAHPAIRLTAAGRNQRIIVMDGMAMLSFGPRTLQSALQLGRALRNSAATRSSAGESR